MGRWVGNRQQRHRLVVSLDAREVEGFSLDQPVKVLARTQEGRTASAPAHFDREGRGSATLIFPGDPGGLMLLVGPGDAPDEELERLRTLGREVPQRMWRGNELVLPALRVPAYWWSWWRRWSRVWWSPGAASPGATTGLPQITPG